MSASPPPSSLPAASNATLFQNSTYAGISLQNVMYGVELVLYFKTIRILLSGARRAHKRSNIFYALFSTAMVFSISVWVVTSLVFCQRMWLQYSNYSGGADAFLAENISVWYMDWGTTAVILLQLMTDGLMIYRCRIIWDSHRVTIIPIFLWFSTLVLGIFVDFTSSAPGGNFFAGVSVQLSLAYYTVSVFLNVVLSCLICYRVVQHGRRIREQLGRDHASLYFTVVSLVVESVLPYTLSGIAFLVSQGMKSSTSVALLPVYLLLMCISPQMLILRVLSGTAWENETTKTAISTIKFNPGRTSGTDGTDNSGTTIHLKRLPKGDLLGGHDTV